MDSSEARGPTPVFADRKWMNEVIFDVLKREVEILLPSMFRFLSLLSYTRFHSKTIITVPRILQLSGGLMATGKDAQFYGMLIIDFSSSSMISDWHNLFSIISTILWTLNNYIEAIKWWFIKISFIQICWFISLIMIVSFQFYDFWLI